MAFEDINPNRDTFFSIIGWRKISQALQNKAWELHDWETVFEIPNVDLQYLSEISTLSKQDIFDLFSWRVVGGAFSVYKKIFNSLGLTLEESDLLFDLIPEFSEVPSDIICDYVTERSALASTLMLEIYLLDYYSYPVSAEEELIKKEELMLMEHSSNGELIFLIQHIQTYEESLQSIPPEPPYLEAGGPEFEEWFDPKPEYCFLYTEMDGHVIINRVSTLEVIVSAKELNFESGPSAQWVSTDIDPERNLIIQIIAKENFITVGDDRIEVTPSTGEETAKFYFDVRATHLGKGEIWVVISQRQMLLSTLSIKPHIVDSRAELKAMATSASETPIQQPPARNIKIRTQSTIEEFPSGKAPLHQLRIIEQNHGGRITYRYDFESRTLGILQSFESKPLASDRQVFIENLYQEIGLCFKKCSEMGF